MNKICPLRTARPVDASQCIGENCAWWCKFAKQCAVPLAAEILADSDICNNVWEPVYTKKDGENE